MGKLTCSGPDHLQVNFKKVNLGGGREEGGPKVHSTSMVISRSHNNNNNNNGFHFLSDINTNKYHSSLVQNIKHKVI